MGGLRFEDLIEAYHDEIFRYLWRMNPGGTIAGTTAEDLTQEAFLRAYRAFPRLKPQSNARAWLYKIATNCAYSQLRKLEREQVQIARTPHQPWHADPPDPEIELQSRQGWDQIVAAIQRLPHKQRLAVHLRYLQELPYSEVAQVLETSEEGARANVYQGLSKLREWLDDEVNPR